MTRLHAIYLVLLVLAALAVWVQTARLDAASAREARWLAHNDSVSAAVSDAVHVRDMALARARIDSTRREAERDSLYLLLLETRRAASVVRTDSIAYEVARVEYRDAPTAERCDLALAACDAYAGSLLVSRNAERDARRSAESVAALALSENDALRDGLRAAGDALDACEAGRADLADAYGSLPSASPVRAYVGPALTQDAALGVVVGVPLSARLPLVGRVRGLGVATLAPGCATVGIGIGL